MTSILAVLALIATAIPVAAQDARDDSIASLTAVSDGLSVDSTFVNTPVVDSDAKLVSVFVRLGYDPAAEYDGEIAGLPATSARATGKKFNPNSAAYKKYNSYVSEQNEAFEQELRAITTSGRVVHELDVLFGGVTVVIAPDEVDELAKVEGVSALYVDEVQNIDLDASAEFLGTDQAWDQLGGVDVAGDGVVVGIVDSGIWPENPLFADDGSYPSPPADWTGDECDFGSTPAGFHFTPSGEQQDLDAPFTCNNKLLGARTFLDTYKLVNPDGVPGGIRPVEYTSARDAHGHGTHTASTAAGNAGVAATVFGVDYGLISGVAPRAHLAVYRVCSGPQGSCFSSDSAAAVQQAILDGVDVINFSIGGGSDPYNDTASLAFLDAYAAGVLVTPSAGNSGPGADTVGHREPWTLTVGASTHDRGIGNSVTLTANNGDTLTLDGTSLSGGTDSPLPVVFAGDYPGANSQCDGDTTTPTVADPFPAGTFDGELVICDRGGFERVGKSANVAAGGAGAMILRNIPGGTTGTAADPHTIPSTHIDVDEGQELEQFMNTHTDVTGEITSAAPVQRQGDTIAGFSSRGGNGQTLGISKPDVVAPGVTILAGYSPTPQNPFDVYGDNFAFLDGTSMAAPHGAGLAALVAQAHPDWTPGQIKSAIMLTAVTDGVFDTDGVSEATPFDSGSGRINPLGAINAGLTINATASEYLAHEDDLWNANYPSVYIPELSGSITVSRTVESQLSKNQQWSLSVVSEDGLEVDVPKKILVKKGDETTFDIGIDGRSIPIGETRHATIYLEAPGTPTLSMPVTVNRTEAVTELSASCDPTDVAFRGTTSCTIEVTNTALVDADVSIVNDLPLNLDLVGGTVEGADADYAKEIVSWSGVLGAAQAPIVTAMVDPLASFAGYLPMNGFGPLVLSASDESINNVNVPGFTYQGQTWNTIGVVSNGYLVVGGGDGGDVTFINDPMPLEGAPDNVLAPYWTDLDPSAGGTVQVATIGVGSLGLSWIVVEWQDVPHWSNGAETNTFQVWIGYGPNNSEDDIAFVYGPDINAGDGGFLTVGAENIFGNEGNAIYFDGEGTPPAPSFPSGDFEIDVTSAPGAPGETKTITYEARGVRKGSWTSYVELTSSLFQGVSIETITGTVAK
jgi:subtilisin family serine protease